MKRFNSLNNLPFRQYFSINRAQAFGCRFHNSDTTINVGNWRQLAPLPTVFNISRAPFFVIPLWFLDIHLPVFHHMHIHRWQRIVAFGKEQQCQIVIKWFRSLANMCISWLPLAAWILNKEIKHEGFRKLVKIMWFIRWTKFVYHNAWSNNLLVAQPTTEISGKSVDTCSLWINITYIIKLRGT